MQKIKIRKKGAPPVKTVVKKKPLIEYHNIDIMVKTKEDAIRILFGDTAEPKKILKFSDVFK